MGRGFCFSSRRRQTTGALVTGVQTCALPISCQGVPVWRKLEATRGGRIEKLNAELCARGGERWLPTFIIATMRFRHQMCGDVGPSERCGSDRPPSWWSLYTTVAWAGRPPKVTARWICLLNRGGVVWGREGAGHVET